MKKKERLGKETIIFAFSEEIAKRLSLEIAGTETEDFTSLFLELVKAIEASSLKGGEAAEIFDKLAEQIDRSRHVITIGGKTSEWSEGNRYRANEALSFRAERFFRDHYREQIDSMDLPGKMEFLGERLEAFRSIPLEFGQAYVIPALEYLNRTFESEIERQLKTVTIREALRLSYKPESNEEEANGAKLLAGVCQLFADAMPDTRQVAWEMLLNFSRKQWAYFADRTLILQGSSKTERAKQIETIAGVTTLRDLFGKLPTATDKKAVYNVVVLLQADTIKAQNGK